MTSQPTPLHRAARAEDAARAAVARLLRSRGWTPRVIPFAGYGTAGRVRVLGRVLLCPPGSPRRERDRARGWRRFLSAAVDGVEVEIAVAGRRTTVESGRGGYLDVLVDADPPPGCNHATLSVGDTTSDAMVFVVPPEAGVGLVSDIDDTVMITAMPRPLLAFWNTFVRHESSRRPVPGMALLYREVVARHPDAFVVYLSTGAWNVAPALTAFLERHGFPPGPLLLTDWGPTAQGWFRSGREHKRAQLQRLATELPQLRWLLVGDDGQHDPQLYREAAHRDPERVRAIAVRQLTVSEQVLTHGTPAPLPDAGPPASAVPEVQAPDGEGLLRALLACGALAARDPGRSSPPPV